MSDVIDLRSSLDGRVALVTGGLGGIGRECIRVLLAHGARVAFTYAAGQESAADAQGIVDGDPERLSAHGLDLRSVVSIQACVAEAASRWGTVDILVNNAAVGSATVAAYVDAPDEQDSVMFTINADGALKMCQAFLALVTEAKDDRPRKLINISSVGGGVQVFPYFRLADGMSKAAVATLTRQLAAELVHTPIDVFAICPGATNTRMFQASTLDNLSPTERETFVHGLAKRRLIEPVEVANLVAFLASSYSTLMHGAVIDASMGLGVRPGLSTESHH